MLCAPFILVVVPHPLEVLPGSGEPAGPFGGPKGGGIGLDIVNVSGVAPLNPVETPVDMEVTYPKKRRKNKDLENGSGSVNLRT